MDKQSSISLNNIVTLYYTDQNQKYLEINEETKLWTIQA